MNNRLFRFTFLIAGAVCFWLLFQPSSPALALDEENPFAVSLVESEAIIEQGKSSEVVVNYEVFKDHFIYRDMSSLAVVDASGLNVGEAKFPSGISKFDKISDKQREIYRQGFKVAIPISASLGLSPGLKTVRLLAKWQGCNLPKNYCLFPAREELAVTVRVLKAKDAPRAGPS